MEDLQESPGLVARVFRLLILGISTFLLFQFVSLYLSWPKQAVLGGLTLFIAIVLNKMGKSHVVSLALMLLSLAATLRYGWWRIHLLIDYFRDESNHRISIDSLLMLILLSAEIYTFCIMVLGYMQTSYLLRRKPIPLPADEALWPHVDVLIPTYNEALALVRYTALAAINIDYPPDKLHVYILDDGTREEFRLFAEEAGVGYITRKKHNHAKAGNINHALTKMHSPLVAIFDCDHVPTRSFLQFTAGWFLVEPRLAMLQTPHFFYSPDPFERNLLQYKSIPNEGELFYGIIQDGNDFWNATFFCGSCAVLRRKALDEVGGIATETVTEDAHTSLRMQSRGWNTAYINVPQAAGLATETLAGHVGQRVRWARGMIQILRTNNPLLASGMKLTQRLCYFNAMAHFMYAVPRLVFLLAPLAYMLLGRTIIPGFWLAILAYALPHLVISSLTNSRIQGRHRHSFWNEIYETVLAPYILLPTLLALINPKLGSFNVTDKGTTLNQTRFDRKIAAPTTWMLLANFAGVLVTPYRLFVLDTHHPGVIISNLFWILFNMVILGVAAAVAHEQRQRRSSVRIPAQIPIIAQFADGRRVEGITRDMSVGGASITFSEPGGNLKSGDVLHLAFPAQTGDAQIMTTIVGTYGAEIRLQFLALSLSEQETLTRALYSRADSWIHGHENIEDDRPLVSFGRILRLSFAGFKQVILGFFPAKRTLASQSVNRSISLFLVVLLTLTASQCFSQPIGAQTIAMHQRPSPALSGEQPIGQVNDAPIKNTISLKDAGVLNAAEMRGPHSYYGVHFVLPYTQDPRSAHLKLSYHFSRSLGQFAGALRVTLNNTLLGEILSPVPAQQDGQYGFAALPVPADLLVRDNDLTFEFTGNEGMKTEENAKSAVLLTIDQSSAIEIASNPILLDNDLSLLPLPIFDRALQTTTTIPFVFLAEPTPKTLQAAGIVASWFGLLATSKPVRFSVSVGQIPGGNAVVFRNKSFGADRNPGLPDSIGPANYQPTISLKTNPTDPTGTVLILDGQDDDQLVAAAQALSLIKIPVPATNGEIAASLGDTEHISNFDLPAPRKADDAPRWLPGDRPVSLWSLSLPSNLQGDGSKPIPIYFHVAPDLYYGENENLSLLVNYRYNMRAVAAGSALRIFVNGVLINEAQLPPGSDSSDRLRKVFLPVVDMRPFGNTLLFNFDFNAAIPSSGDQSSVPLHAAILKASTLDLTGLDHWVRMPNLELFANAGYPFTQWADLSRTIVVLPARPSAQEITLFLGLMNHCGMQTGYPALRMEVRGPYDQIRKDRDYLVLGTIANQPAFAALQANLPVTFESDGIHVSPDNSILHKVVVAWQNLFNHGQSDPVPSTDDGIPSALVEGIESPYAPGHSLVIVALRNDASEEEFTNAFLDRSQSSDIAHSVSLLRGTSFVSYSLDTTSYHIGDISSYTLMRIWLTEYFWLLAGVVTLCSLVLANWINQYLKKRAAIRLRHKDTLDASLLSNSEIASDHPSPKKTP